MNAEPAPCPVRPGARPRLVALPGGGAHSSRGTGIGPDGALCFTSESGVQTLFRLRRNPGP